MIPDEDQDPVRRATGITRIAKPVQQVGDIFVGDLIEWEMAELRQDMDAQHGLVGAPAPLRVLHEGQIGVANEFGQASVSSAAPCAPAADRCREWLLPIPLWLCCALAKPSARAPSSILN